MTRNQIILCVVSTVTSLLGLEIFAQVKLYQQSQLRPPIYIADPILGFRLKHALEVKPTKTTRILMLGDSFTQGNEVSQTFSQLLAAKLNVQVINAGIRGGSPLQYYLWLKTEGLKFDPDIVVLNFYLGNDINDRSCLEIVGVPVIVADAFDEVRSLAKYQTQKKGGMGAVREVCDWIIKCKENEK